MMVSGRHNPKYPTPALLLSRLMMNFLLTNSNDTKGTIRSQFLIVTQELFLKHFNYRKKCFQRGKKTLKF